MELDHVFVCVSQGAPEAARLAGFGLSEGAPNRHPGQGTACRRFFFENAYLELVWVDEPAECQSANVRPTGLWERWSGRGFGASPFGIALRPAGQEQPQAPFPTWPYRPAYLPDPLEIQIATNSQVVTEPLLFMLGFGRRPDSAEPARRQPLEHPAGLCAITRILINTSDSYSNELAILEQRCGWLRLAVGPQPLVEIGFDEESSGRRADFRPALPLVFLW
jgi:hypothetical protein